MLMVSSMKVSGKMMILMVMAQRLGLMVTSMKVSGKILKKMFMVQ